MKIIVLNGSPKGDVSVTMQYIAYMKKQFPDHEYQIFNVAQEIKKLEKDEIVFGQIMDAVRSADLVLWGFPLYFLLVCSQYKRFIELLYERNMGEVFSGKYTAALSTSIHYFDHTANNYIHAICDDLGMNYCGFFSAEMYDLLRKRERNRFMKFLQFLFTQIQAGTPIQSEHAPLLWPSLSYTPGQSPDPYPSQGKKIVILTDSDGNSTNLDKMTDRLKQIFLDSAELINLHELDIQGGCLGCIHCGYDNTCIYNDGFRDFYTTKLETADIIIIAGTVHDRYLSSTWKQFFDRSFFEGHTPSLKGKQIGFVIDGPLQQLPYLKEALSGWTDNQGVHVLFVTGEVTDSEKLDTLLDALASNLVWGAENGYVPPHTFYAVGGHKIFRDAIYQHLRVAFPADYKYYLANRMFDFPQKDLKTRIFNAIILPLLKIPNVRKSVFSDIKRRMVEPFKNVV